MESKLSSQSSGISLADISVNDISDSDLDNEETVFESVASGKSSISVELYSKRHAGNYRGRQDSVDTVTGAMANNARKPHLPSSLAVSASDQDREMYAKNECHMPLGDVKFTLQENHDLLSDHALLKELLQSIDIKLETTAKSIKSANLSFGPPNRDPGPGVVVEARSASPLEEPTAQQQLDKQLVVPNIPVRHVVEESRKSLTDIKICGKHVTFDKRELDGKTSESSDNWPPVTGDFTKSHELLK